MVLPRASRVPRGGALAPPLFCEVRRSSRAWVCGHRAGQGLCHEGGRDERGGRRSCPQARRSSGDAPLHTVCAHMRVCARVREAETGGQGQGKGLSAAHALPATAPGPLHAPRLACGISLPRGLRACSLTPAGPGSHLTSRRTPAAPSAAAPALPGPPCPLLVPQGARPLLPPVAWSRPLPGVPAPLGVCLLLSVRPQLGPQRQGTLSECSRNE